ncbi:hypothetical protein P691DRAFT_689444 [Macrolepiota fuliginosa MF-IS2]|uniref:RNase H type-1 domain-containing protein n=1 Tax=Macrolepiota fuliginosa MF-IS2 TaxID=1400762 RepID=A0A9P5WYX1_9AGAR|nr:hypothetical protein P691DRAFT_689444 [Macrolepiota fuliginosa MF-IS2]
MKVSSPKWIYYWEALAVLLALLHASHLPSASKILIHTDNTNTVDMFNTFAAQPLYNPILILAANHLIAHQHALHVVHIQGEDNTVADTLSQ